MRGIELLEMMEFIDPEYIEAADALPEKTVITSFRPWMKWAVAAILIVVIGVGTPVALNMMGVFRNENYVAPNGSGSSGFVAPADGSSESGSGQSPEGESSSKADEPSNSGETPSSSSDQPGGSSSETPDVSSPGTSESDAPEQPEGDFVKDNMPAVTYRINGEYKTFDYQSSTAVTDSGSSCVIDRYVGSDGSTVSVDAGAGEVMRYEKGDTQLGNLVDCDLDSESAVNMARNVLINSDISINGIENASISIRYSYDIYYISFAFIERSAEVCLNNTGELQYFVINNDAHM